MARSQPKAVQRLKTLLGSTRASTEGEVEPGRFQGSTIVYHNRSFSNKKKRDFKGPIFRKRAPRSINKEIKNRWLRGYYRDMSQTLPIQTEGNDLNQSVESSIEVFEDDPILVGSMTSPKRINRLRREDGGQPVGLSLETDVTAPGGSVIPRVVTTEEKRPFTVNTTYSGVKTKKYK